jgi:hypothetical protein
MNHTLIQSILKFVLQCNIERYDRRNCNGARGLKGDGDEHLKIYNELYYWDTRLCLSRFSTDLTGLNLGLLVGLADGR